MRFYACLFVIALCSGCASARPKNTNDICTIFEDKRGWYKEAKAAAKKWNTEIPLLMAFIRRESDFVATAKPPRTKLLWVIPWVRLSDAYGYPQALDATWREYKKAAGSVFAGRDDFGDAVDFIGWYNNQSIKRCKIRRNDPYNLYLAYHEGQGGYNRGSYRGKTAVKSYAQKVQNRTSLYRAQLKKCEAELNRKRWLFF